MATPPSEVRTALTTVAADGAAEVTTIAAQAGPDAVSVLMEAVPGIVDFYLDAAAELALEWYEELRVEASPSRLFEPAPITPLRVDLIQNQITSAARDIAANFEREMARVAADLEAEAQRAVAERVASFAEEEIAGGFRATIVENSERDPAAAGWRRFARPEACKFCKMLAAKGAVFTKETARFAAHGATTGGKVTGGNCMCIAGPAFKGAEEWAEATPMQYVASQRDRTEKQRADLRAYLNKNFPDDRG